MCVMKTMGDSRQTYRHANRHRQTDSQVAREAVSKEVSVNSDMSSADLTCLWSDSTLSTLHSLLLTHILHEKKMSETEGAR